MSKANLQDKDDDCIHRESSEEENEDGTQDESDDVTHQRKK